MCESKGGPGGSSSYDISFCYILLENCPVGEGVEGSVLGFT